MVNGNGARRGTSVALIGALLVAGLTVSARAAKAPASGLWEEKRAAACAATTAFDDLKNRTDMGPEGGAGVNDAFLCQALTEKNSQACRNVGPWIRRSLGELKGLSGCEENYLWLRIRVAALKRDPEALTLCIQQSSASSADKKRKACESYVQAVQAGQARGFCDRVAQLEGGDFNPAGCREENLPLEGPEACRAVADPFKRAGCRKAAILMRALASGNKADCGASRLCLVAVSGTPELCSTVRKEAVERYCREKAANDYHYAVENEVKFRKENDLAPFKPGDPLLSDLPSAERMRYEKRARKRLEKEKARAPAKRRAPESSDEAAPPASDQAP